MSVEDVKTAHQADMHSCSKNDRSWLRVFQVQEIIARLDAAEQIRAEVVEVLRESRLYFIDKDEGLLQRVDALLAKLREADDAG